MENAPQTPHQNDPENQIILLPPIESDVKPVDTSTGMPKRSRAEQAKAIGEGLEKPPIDLDAPIDEEKNASSRPRSDRAEALSRERWRDLDYRQ